MLHLNKKDTKKIISRNARSEKKTKETQKSNENFVCQKGLIDFINKIKQQQRGKR